MICGMWTRRFREYYEIGDFVTVAPEEDAAVAKDVKKPRRGKRSEEKEEPVKAPSEEENRRTA